ncbi:MAG: 2OG-Fe(II) oxygenase [Alphaproteobacteria bacterium]|nr:2OG-Fe(II) oxygenase [Alphaproteobacteria bacterium]
MNFVANTVLKTRDQTELSVDIEALARARVETDPFPYAIVPGFVKHAALDAIRADFPIVAHPGSFPLSTLSYGPAFRRLIDDLKGDEMQKIVAERLGLDLANRPTTVTVRGQSRAADGKIHTDSKTKLVTVLIYMNDAWESPKGRLRLVRSADNLDDVVAEVPPDEGTLLLFKNQPNAWHGFEPFAGPRRVIQLNWVTDASVVRREESRHRLSAFFKRLFKKPG